MNRMTGFKKNSIAVAIATVAGLSSQAFAQSDAALEEVVVTGIRGSLEQAMDMKRDGQGVVDAISAEDIGKFPDTNLAESLQRITGVSIDRQNGEGSRVTVRGFGPDYSVVTLNGRQMPAANIDGGSASASRSFDFANLAAESVSAVEVYKTGRADLPTGGIGSVINIRTVRPLDQSDTVFKLGAKTIHDTSSQEGDSLTPELSGIYSGKFADDTIGVAFVGSFSERHSGQAGSETGPGWYTIPGGQGDWGSIAPDNTNFENAPQEGDIYSVPRGVGYNFSETQRERTNALLTLQWAPSDEFEATLDYAYAEQDVERQYNAMGAWFNGVPVSGSFTEGSGNGSVVAPIVYTDATGADVTFNAGEWGTVNKNDSIGLNLAWNPREDLSLSFDYHNSSAENGAKDDRGTNNNIAGVQFNRAATTVNYGYDLPATSFEFIDGQGFDPALMLTSGNVFNNSYMKHDIEQTRFDGTFDVDAGPVQSIDFGIGFSESTNRSAFANVQNDTWGGLGTAADYDDSLFVQKSMASALDDFGSADSADMTPYYYASDFEGMRSAIAAYIAGSGESLNSPCAPVLCASDDFTTDRTAVETQQYVYTQVNLAWEDAPMPMHLVVGMRFEDTEVDAKAKVPQYDSIVWVADNEFRAQSSGVGFSEQQGAYSNFLPNVDFDIELAEDVVARASFSKTITRPGYADIQGGQTIDSLLRFNGGNASRGNPDLDPFESTNFDLSAEWYYGEASYVSFGYYSKDVENFIGQSSFSETTFDLAHPAQGPRFEEAQAAVGNDLGAIRAYLEENYGAPIVGSAAEGDASAVFNVIAPVNAEQAKIDGFEFAVQHMFGDSGFGGQFNFTTVNGDIAYDDFNTNKGEGVENQFALLGLSDSMNIVGFYDKNGIQARVAYNWRDDFLTGTFDGNGERNPVYTAAYGQWDASASYDVQDNLTVFVEGINLTNETKRLYGRHENMMIGAFQTGARYNVGVRYSF